MPHPIRKTIVRIIILLVVVGGATGGYLYYKNQQKLAAVTKYVLGTVTKGTLVVSVSGSGQVASTNQVDVTPLVSGEITSVRVAEGQTVKAGAILATIDDATARKAVRDAQSSLQSAELSLQKLQQPTDATSLLQSQDSVTQAQENFQQAQDTLAKDYDQGYSAVSDSFIDLPKIMNGLDNILHSNDIDPAADNIDYYTDTAARFDTAAYGYRDATNAAYTKAKASYDAAFNVYKSATRSDSHASIEALVTQTYNASEDMSAALKATYNLINFYQNTLSGRLLKTAAAATTNLNSLDTYTGQLDGHLTTLLNQTYAFSNDKTAIIASQRTLSERQSSLATLQSGADAIDVQSQQISIQQRRNALQDAQDNLADYVVRAPIDGLIATMTINKGDQASGGTVIATIVAQSLMVDVPLNEVDVSSIKVGQKATLTFDAYPDLSLTGHVAHVDAIGTVTQGVVNYTVQIIIDGDSNGVKPGMSVTASIITDVQSDVLLVPSTAIKTRAGSSTVDVVSDITADDSRIGNAQGVELATPPVTTPVTTGSADDTNTVIKSGLEEGQVIVTRTVSSTAATAASSSRTSGAAGAAGATGGLRLPIGGGGFGGGR